MNEQRKSVGKGWWGFFRIRRGSALAAIVIMMVLAAMLGLGVAIISSTTTLSETRTNNNHRARYLAEAGLRYALDREQDDSGTYTTDQSDEQIVISETSDVFSIRVMSTGIVASGTANEARATVSHAPDTQPPWNPNDPADPNTFRWRDDFSDLNNWDYDAGKVAIMALADGYGGIDNWATIRCLDGTFAKTDVPKPACLTELTSWVNPSGYYGWSWATDRFQTQPNSIKGNNSGSFHLATWARMEYTTITGEGDLTFFFYKTQNVGVSGFWFEVDGDFKFQEWSDTSDWEQVTVHVTAGQHILSWNFVQIVSSDSIWIDDVKIPGHYVKEETMVLKGTIAKPVDWATAWANANNLLTYDVQTKISWGYQLQYGGNGINFRWQPHPNFTIAPNKKYQGYGYSTIYHRGICHNDYIPDGIKPPGTENLPLLVLWKQTVSDAGDIAKEWLAYKRIPAGDYALGSQNSFDGRRFNDNMSIFVRIIEARDVRGQKYNDIMAFYGDASQNATRVTTLLGNTTASDGNRKVYTPTSYSGSPGIVWPVIFTPLNLASQWSQTYDYMTLVHWDAINTSASGGVNLQTNGYVIRDKSFTTPSNGSFPMPSVYGGDEVGLHAFADSTYCTGNTGVFNVIAFMDFAINLFSPQP